MKKLLLPVFVFLFFSGNILAQAKNPCGTEAYKSEWLKKYQVNPGNYDFKREVTVDIPLTIHLVGRTNKTGKMSESSLLKAMCTLQTDFDGSDIQFYLKEGIRNIDDSEFFLHDEVIDGGYKMWEYNVEGSINCYIVDDPAGNCGYNLPWAGVAVAEACAGVQDHTWAHELGHALSLPHPFLGWEGGVSHDGSVGHDFNNPAPDTILYDYTFFKDSLILDTMIIDTAIVEKTDGSNCHIAADGFCDTKPDYLASRWGCQTDTFSFVEQTDPDSVKFKSDGSLFMSYALDNCSDRFSDEQILAMRANAMDEKGEYTSVDTQFSLPDNPTFIQLIAPFQDEVVYFRDVTFIWTQENPDQYYLFQIGVEPSFSVLLYDTIVSGTGFVLNEVDDSWGELYWRIKAFTPADWCTGFVEGKSFQTTDISSTQEILSEEISIYPNLITSDQNHIFIDNKSGEKIISYEVINTEGQLLKSGNMDKTHIDLGDTDLPGSMYFIKLNINGNYAIKKIMVSR